MSDKPCKCTFRERLIGDGCDICNPAKATEYEKDVVAWNESFITALKVAADVQASASEGKRK